MTTSLPARRRSIKRPAQHARLRGFLPAALAAMALASLAACTPAGQLGVTAEELAAQMEQAQALSGSGDHGAARAAYLSLARRLPNPQRQRFQILAARETGRGGRAERALRELRALEPRPEWLGLWAIAAAESERAIDGPRAAYLRLADVDPEKFPALAPELLRLRSELLFALEQPLKALRELTLLGGDFAEGGGQSANFTWSLLRGYGSGLTTEGATGVPLGWIELALGVSRLSKDPTETSAVLNHWRERFPGHPASVLLAGAITSEVCQSTADPFKIAMLLPGSEQYADARRSLRDGFLAARYAFSAACAAPEVAFYEAAGSSVAPLAWRRAAQEGADFIVGPLLPEAVERVAEIAGERPTLALNWLRTAVPPTGFEEFALAPEHEAQQAARQALQRGLKRALILYPGTRWGRRIVRTFADRYRAGGGEIIAQEQYKLSAVDYSEIIGRLLKIGASNRRLQQLQSRLGRRLNFQPRRRQDVDLVFVAARAPQGQLLIPQLRYNYSGALPIFATQSIFRLNNPDNRDLDGVELPALPLMAAAHIQLSHGQLSPEWLESSDLSIPLFAMGYDSFKLALALHRQPGALAEGIGGLSGMVYRSPGGRLERKLTWTRVVDGKLKAAQPAP